MNWNHRLAIWITDLQSIFRRITMKSPQLPRFTHHTTDKPMPYPIWSRNGRMQRRVQFAGNFMAGVFFTMVFAIVIRMVAGR